MKSLITLGAVAVLSLVAPAVARGQVCAQVTIQIKQDAVVTRTAFEATLTVDNTTKGPLEQFQVDLVIKNAETGEVCTPKFGIPTPMLTGITAVDGSGVLPAMNKGTAQWLIIPSEDAAPGAEPVKYTVGGMVRHTLEGLIVDVPLYPVEIDVYPDAKLFLRYYLQSPVYGDNPFSETVVEPAEPFSLGLLVRNEGFGAAKDLKITSSQPEIINNDKGLLIQFALIGTQVGTQQVQPCLTAKMGTIPPDGSQVARWLMTSSLQGEFVDYKASFEHKNGLDDPSLSLIKDIEIYETTHVCLLVGPEEDDLPDFLVGDGGADYNAGPVVNDPTELPAVIHASDGAILPLEVLENATVDGPPMGSDLIVDLVTMPTSTGWTYLRIDDPGAADYRLVSVMKDDGDGTSTPISVGGPGDIVNAWTTARWQPKNGPPQTLETYLHLLDYVDFAGPQSYQLTYAPVLEVEAFVVNRGLSQRSTVDELRVQFTTATNLAGLISAGTINDVVEVYERPLGGGLGPKVALTPAHFQWDNQDFDLIIDLTEDGFGPSERNLLLEGNYVLRMQTAAIQSLFGAEPLSDGDGQIDGVYTFGDQAEDGFYRLIGDAALTDRVVDMNDLLLVRLAFDTVLGQHGFNKNADLVKDAAIDRKDLQLVTASQGKTLGF